MKASDVITVARPNTLTASASPVLLASALAYHDGAFRWIPALLCLGVAVFAQVASNFANDYFDFKHGMDGNGRLGPERVVATGRVDAKPVLIGALVFLCLSCLCGLGLLFYAPWWIIPVGIVIAGCVFGYSAGPFPLSHHALGDVAVLLFFGLVPVCLTYFVQASTFSLPCLWLAVGMGLVTVNILIVNNYRDVTQDKATGKNTTIVLFGRKAGLIAYFVHIVVAAFLAIVTCFSLLKTCLVGLLFVLMLYTWWQLYTRDGFALNLVLAHTARNVFLYALAVSLGLIWG